MASLVQVRSGRVREAMTEEDIKRFEIVQDLVAFMGKFVAGTAAIWTHYWVLRQLVLGNKPAVSKKMSLIQDLKKNNPDLLQRLEPYLDPECDLLKGSKASLVALGKKQVSW